MLTWHHFGDGHVTTLGLHVHCSNAIYTPEGREAASASGLIWSHLTTLSVTQLVKVGIVEL